MQFVCLLVIKYLYLRQIVEGTTFLLFNTKITRFMEKEQLLSAMTERLGTTGLSERTISEYVDNILPTITSDEMVNDGFWNIHTKILKSLEGNLNHDVANRVNAFKSEWEKNNPKPQDPKPKEQPKEDPNMELYKTLVQKIENLEKQNAETFFKNTVSDLRGKVLNKADELRVSNRNLWNDAVGAVVYREGMTENELLTEAKVIYESKQKAYFGDSAVPYSAGSASNQKAAEADLDAYFARKGVVKS